MRYLIITSLFFATICMGCVKSKLSDTGPTYDQANKIFRTIVDANAKYSISIISSAPDTLLTQISGGLEFNYGFPTKVGDVINVKVLAPNATSLTCTILYNGVEIVPAVSDTQLQGGGLEADYQYTVSQ
jgi:hypothetical protein